MLKRKIYMLIKLIIAIFISLCVLIFFVFFANIISNIVSFYPINPEISKNQEEKIHSMINSIIKENMWDVEELKFSEPRKYIFLKDRIEIIVESKHQNYFLPTYIFFFKKNDDDWQIEYANSPPFAGDKGITRLERRFICEHTFLYYFGCFQGRIPVYDYLMEHLRK